MSRRKVKFMISMIISQLSPYLSFKHKKWRLTDVLTVSDDSGWFFIIYFAGHVWSLSYRNHYLVHYINKSGATTLLQKILWEVNYRIINSLKWFQILSNIFGKLMSLFSPYNITQPSGYLQNAELLTEVAQYLTCSDYIVMELTKRIDFK